MKTLADVLQKVLTYLSSKDALVLRRVCKKMDEIVQENWRYCPNEYFRVCNNPWSIQTFVGLSKNFPLKQFQFEGLDLETNLFGDQETFRRFTNGHCLSMSALVIKGCTLSTGRFLELLGFCKNLKHLAILESPSVFRVENGIGIIHWSFCYKSVRSNLANLQKLSISGKLLKDVDVWGLGIGIRGLKELQVLSEAWKLPMDGINKIVKNNCETLKVLVLRGVITQPCLEIDTGTVMKSLQRLQLEKNKIGVTAMKQVGMFLEKCPCLTELHISNSKLEKTAISKVTPNLIILRLWNCEYDTSSFVDAKFPNLQRLSLFTGMQVEPIASQTLEALKALSDCELPKLTHVDLRLLSNGSAYLKSLQVIKYQQLTKLSLSNCSDIAGPRLREIFKNLTELLSLSIKKCFELNDDNVCPGTDNDETGSLANLEKLRFLDLSGSSVGNRTILDCIIKMGQLKSIKLNDETIKVDKAGLQTIIEATKTNLKSLKHVSVSKCMISRDEYKELRLLAPQVTLNCRIETSYGVF